jgi:hypothetical protein
LRINKIRRLLPKSDVIVGNLSKMIKESKKNNNSRSPQIMKTKVNPKTVKIFNKMTAGKIIKMLDKKNDFKAKNFHDLLKYRPSEGHLNILEQAIKHKRIINKELVKAIQFAEGLLKNLEIRLMKIENDRRRQVKAKESSIVPDTLIEVKRLKKEFFTNENFFDQLKSSLKSTYNEIPSTNELRQDKAKAKQKKYVQRLIEEERNTSKHQQRLQDLINLISKKAKQTQVEESKTIDNNDPKSNIFDKKAKKWMKFGENFPSKLSKALKKYVKQNTIDNTKKSKSPMFQRTTSEQKPSLSGMGKNSTSNSNLDSIYLKTDSVLNQLKAKLPAFLAGGRGTSFFSKHTHFDGSADYDTSKQSVPIFKLGKPDKRKSDQVGYNNFLMGKQFRTSKDGYTSSRNKMIPRSSSKTSIEKFPNNTFNFNVKNEPKMRTIPSKNRFWNQNYNPKDLENKIENILGNKFNAIDAIKGSPNMTNQKDQYEFTPNEKFFKTMDHVGKRNKEKMKKRNGSPKSKKKNGFNKTKRAKSNDLLKMKKSKFQKDLNKKSKLKKNKKKKSKLEKMDFSNVKSKVDTVNENKLQRNNNKISFPGKDKFKFEKSVLSNSKASHVKQKRTKPKNGKKKKVKSFREKKAADKNKGKRIKTKNSKKIPTKNRKHSAISIKNWEAKFKTTDFQTNKPIKSDHKKAKSRKKINKSSINVFDKSKKPKRKKLKKIKLYKSSISNIKPKKKKKGKKYKKKKTLFTPGSEIQYDNFKIKISKPRKTLIIDNIYSTDFDNPHVTVMKTESVYKDHNGETNNDFTNETSEGRIVFYLT